MFYNYRIFGESAFCHFSVFPNHHEYKILTCIYCKFERLTYPILTCQIPNKRAKVFQIGTNADDNFELTTK